MKENKIVFGIWETTTVLINMICTKIFLDFARLTAEDSGTAGWIEAIVICLVAFISFIIITKLYKNFEGKDLLDIGEHIGGNLGRIITGMIIIFFLLYIIPVVLREFSEDMKVISLSVSPISFVTIFFLTGMIAGAYAGLEAIVRFHAIAVPVIATGYLIILVGVSPYIDLTNLQPVLGNGALSIAGKGFLRLSVFSELIFAFLMVPYIKTHKNFKKAGYTAIALSSFFIIICPIVFLSALAYPTSMESFLPIYQLARLINYGRFFQRIESLFVLIWAAAALLYLTVGFYFIIHVFRKTFKLDYYKPLIIPFSIIVFIISLLPNNLMTVIFIETKIINYYSFIITFVATILLLIVGKFIKKGAKKKEAGKNEMQKCE